MAKTLELGLWSHWLECTISGIKDLLMPDLPTPSRSMLAGANFRAFQVAPTAGVHPPSTWERSFFAINDLCFIKRSYEPIFRSPRNGFPESLGNKAFETKLVLTWLEEHMLTNGPEAGWGQGLRFATVCRRFAMRTGACSRLCSTLCAKPTCSSAPSAPMVSGSPSRTGALLSKQAVT